MDQGVSIFRDFAFGGQGRSLVFLRPGIFTPAHTACAGGAASVRVYNAAGVRWALAERAITELTIMPRDVVLAARQQTTQLFGEDSSGNRLHILKVR